MEEIKQIFHSISLKRKQYFSKLLETYDLKLMEVEILAFLSEQPDSNTFTEIMRAKDYAKSHVSNAINKLVENEFIEKQSMRENKKVYKLFLLEKSVDVIKEYDVCVGKFQADAFKDITDVEVENYKKVLNKMNENLISI